MTKQITAIIESGAHEVCGFLKGSHAPDAMANLQFLRPVITEDGSPHLEGTGSRRHPKIHLQHLLLHHRLTGHHGIENSLFRGEAVTHVRQPMAHQRSPQRKDGKKNQGRLQPILPYKKRSYQQHAESNCPQPCMNASTISKPHAQDQGNGYFQERIKA